MKFPVAAVLAACSLISQPVLFAQTPEPSAEKERKPELGTVAPAAPATTTRTIVDSLTEAELDAVIPLLKQNYIKADALSDLEMKRGQIQGVVDRMAPGVALRQPAAGGELPSSPFRAEILDGRIGYVRLGSTTPGNVAELDATLRKFGEKPLGALVLDLRATPPSSDFLRTAEVCKRFCPKGKVLFSVKKPNIKQEQILTSNDDPKFTGIVVVLVDRDTAGNAEVIAAVLRTHVKAMVIGQQTKGEAVEFADLPLQSGKLLRVAVAEVALPENVSVFPGGVKPDLKVEVSQETTDLVLQQALEKGVSELVFETERPRMNEAALVAGTNPEFDAIQATQRAKAEKGKTPLHDAVLQRAVDFITTIAIYEKKETPK